MAIGDYISKNKAALLYILDLLVQRSDPDHPLKQAEIRKILEGDPYNLELDRDTIEANLQELQAFYDDSIVCKTSRRNDGSEYRTGWYFKRPSADEDLKDLIYYIRASDLPEKEKRKSIKTLHAYRSQRSNVLMNPLTDERESSGVFFQEHQMSDQEYENYLTITKVIEENRHRVDDEICIRFRSFFSEIRGKKVVQDDRRVVLRFLPLAIAQKNEHLYMIGFNSFELDSYRLDRIGDIRKRVRRKLTDKNALDLKSRANEEEIRKYLNDHLFDDHQAFMPELDEKEYPIELGIRNEMFANNVGRFIDYYGRDFRIIDSDEQYHYIRIRSTITKLLEMMILSNSFVVVEGPEEIKKAIDLEMRLYASSLQGNDYAITRINIFRKKSLPKDARESLKAYDLLLGFEYAEPRKTWIYSIFYGSYDLSPEESERIEEEFEAYLTEKGFRQIRLAKENDAFYSEELRSVKEVEALLKGFIGSRLTDTYYKRVRVYKDDEKVNYDRFYGICSRRRLPLIVFTRRGDKQIRSYLYV